MIASAFWRVGSNRQHQSIDLLLRQMSRQLLSAAPRNARDTQSEVRFDLADFEEKAEEAAQMSRRQGDAGWMLWRLHCLHESNDVNLCDPGQLTDGIAKTKLQEAVDYIGKSGTDGAFAQATLVSEKFHAILNQLPAAGFFWRQLRHARLHAPFD